MLPVGATSHVTISVREHDMNIIAISENMNIPTQAKIIGRPVSLSA
jgi:hypothetical protein